MHAPHNAGRVTPFGTSGIGQPSDRPLVMGRPRPPAAATAGFPAALQHRQRSLLNPARHLNRRLVARCHHATARGKATGTRQSRPPPEPETLGPWRQYLLALVDKPPAAFLIVTEPALNAPITGSVSCSSVERLVAEDGSGVGPCAR
jgi:hypothetical protein